MLLKISFIYFIPTLVSFPPLPPARLLEDRLPEGSNEEKFPTSEICCQCCCRSEIIEQGCRFGDLHALTDTPFYHFLTALQLQRTSIFPEEIFSLGLHASFRIASGGWRAFSWRLMPSMQIFLFAASEKG